MATFLLSNTLKDRLYNCHKIVTYYKNIKDFDIITNYFYKKKQLSIMACGMAVFVALPSKTERKLEAV